ncbi:hypothetical protein [Gordonia paraffinivorans]|uniref:hypothetical protein n=1 Tax=Gordonia paraffinivorans TaxID=175628 RepID=UPI001445CA9B|nr:hypothetical protein [Gordonia paraffinivorans]
MVLPLIPVVAIAVGTAAGSAGLALGGKGAYDLKKASSELNATRERYETRRSASEALASAVNDRIAQYGTQQEQAIRDVVLRMHDFLIRNEKKVRDNEKLLVDGIEASVNLVSGSHSMDLSVAQWVRGIIGSVGAGAGAGAATSAAATTFGVASTGAAISGLSGAAAESAALAWLGGGAVAAGGGGMALGALALNFVTIGPGLLVAGFVVNGQGKKAVTQALDYKARIEAEIAKLDVADAHISAVEARTEELSRLLAEITRKGSRAVDELEEVFFDPAKHAHLFQRAMILVKGVIDIATTPVIDEDGELTDEGHQLTIKYRAMNSDDLRTSATSPTTSSEAKEATP